MCQYMYTVEASFDPTNEALKAEGTFMWHEKMEGHTIVIRKATLRSTFLKALKKKLSNAP